MSEPIDLLDIASCRKADAHLSLQRAMTMQAPHAAAIAYDFAVWEYFFAARDVSVLLTLAMELSA